MIGTYNLSAKNGPTAIWTFISGLHVLIERSRYTFYLYSGFSNFCYQNNLTTDVPKGWQYSEPRYMVIIIILLSCILGKLMITTLQISIRYVGIRYLRWYIYVHSYPIWIFISHPQTGDKFFIKLKAYCSVCNHNYVPKYIALLYNFRVRIWILL